MESFKKEDYENILDESVDQKIILFLSEENSGASYFMKLYLKQLHEQEPSFDLKIFSASRKSKALEEINIYRLPAILGFVNGEEMDRLMGMQPIAEIKRVFDL